MRPIHHIKKALKTPEFVNILILRTIGNFLVIGSLFLIAKTFYLPVKEEIKYALDRASNKIYLTTTKKEAGKIKYTEVQTAPKGLLAKAFNIKSVEVLIPDDPNFDIVIPKIGANSKIIPNVSAADENIYLPALKKGVAQAAGSAYPGEGDHIFLFAHSTDYFWNVGTYNAVFYLLYKLEKGDEVDLFYQGQRYVYKVVGREIVDPSQVQYLTRKTNREFLTLQTCWPPGTTLKRLLIFATRVIE